MKRGDIFFASLDPARGAEIQKTRPVVVLSNDASNRASALVTIVPLTSNVTTVYPFEVRLDAKETGLSKDGKAMAQQVRTIDRSRLGSIRRGQVPAQKMQAINDALRLHLAL